MRIIAFDCDQKYGYEKIGEESQLRSESNHRKWQLCHCLRGPL